MYTTISSRTSYGVQDSQVNTSCNVHHCLRILQSSAFLWSSPQSTAEAGARYARWALELGVTRVRAAPLRVRSLRAVDSLASLLPCVHSRASLGYDSSTWFESFHGDDIVGLLRGAAPRCSPRVARPSRQSCGGQTGHQRWARHCGRKGHQEGCLLRRRRNAGRYTPGRWRADAAALRLTSWGQAACCA